ncbi:hypothetical protein WICMUC_002009 [Wickerhamomyces mucosus]|uniref:Cargo-transport protein YPP1 n=1 Tax=Wickerhamomyces mucosus TaxID=1378264 RepID=A0A9P8PQ63_9ASCO|nr:hypothetical protein WICMUC_002009 [Wickerhamomyces mucosus]
MVKIEDSLVNLITSREYGVYPSSVTTLTTDELLFKALNIEYRLFQYLLSSNNNNGSYIRDLINESESLILDNNSIAQIVLKVNLGYLYYLFKQYKKSITILETIQLIDLNTSSSFLKSLYYKSYYIIALDYDQLNQLNESKNILLVGINLFPYIPLRSEIESSYWLIQLFNQLKNHLPESNDIKQLDILFKSKNLLIYYLNYLTNKISGFDQLIVKRADLLLSQTKFPKSSESNSYELEEFFEIITSKPSLIDPATLISLIEIGISKTYQSQKVLKSYIKSLIYSNKYDQLEAAFDVLLEYLESYYILNDNTYYDVLSILEIFSELLLIKQNDSYYKFDKIDVYLQKFKNILLEFYKENELEIIEDEDNDDQIPKFENISQNLKSKLSDFWYVISITQLNSIKNSNLIEFDNFNSHLVIQNFKNCIYLNLNETNHFFEFITTLALLRKIKNGYKFLTQFVKTLKNDTLIYFKSIHLLALVLSIEENKEESFKIINFLIQEIIEFLENSTSVESLSFELKRQFIEIKITQLSIIESLYGIEQSLDSLNELFELFNKLFQNVIIKNPEPIAVASSTQYNAKEHKKSLSLTRHQTLTKIKSISKSHKNKPTIKNDPENNSLNQLKISKEYTKECRLLQKIWLITSQIYFKLNLIKESEESLVEAENSYKPTDETFFQLGSLFIKGKRLTYALKEFEKGLELNKNSIPCIVGLSNLILDDNNANDQVFINEKDRLAALARIKIYLEDISKSFQGNLTSEVWFLLSKIYEKFGDAKRLNRSLWRAIELEESRPLRDFNNV